MNLEESDLYREKLEKNTRNRKGVMLSIVLCALLIVGLVAMIAILQYQDSITDKIFVDNTQQQGFPDDFYEEIEGTIYLNVNELATLLKYTYNQGEYNKFNENNDSCYLKNDLEIVAMSVDSNKYQKYIEASNQKVTIADISVSVKNKNGYCENFDLVKPLKFIDGKIYVSKEDAAEMFNLRIDWKQYRYRFYTLDYVVRQVKTSIAQLGYTQISGYYENLKSVLYNFVVVSKGTEGSKGNLYGVISLNENGREVIGVKYNDIKFVQNVKEFYVTASNGTMGILNSEGGTIIAPSEFENISLLDDEKQLYLVEKDGEYGVVNRNGKTLIHAENDKIGFDVSDFEIDNIENSSLLFGQVIPVQKDDQYGLYNAEGDLILPITIDDLGYKTGSRETTSGHEESVLLIPPSVGIKGIVINKDDAYGIFDITAERIVLPCVCTKIYAITKSGETTYYMEHDGQSRPLRDFLEEQNLINIDENEEKEEKNSNSEIETTSNENKISNTTDDKNSSTNTENTTNKVSNSNTSN